MIGVTLLSLAVGCGQSESLPNAAGSSTPSQQLCAKFIRQAMGSNEVRFKDWGDTQTGPQNRPTMSISWEVRKNDYWEQRTTMIFLPVEPIDPGKKYSAVGDVEGRLSQLWMTEADAKDVIPQLPSGDNGNDNRPAHK